MDIADKLRRSARQQVLLCLKFALSLVTHQAGAYPSFLSMKRLKKYFYSPGRDVSLVGQRGENQGWEVGEFYSTASGQMYEKWEVQIPPPVSQS